MPTSPSSQAVQQAAVDAYEAMRYGMFVHWGGYSVYGGVWKGESLPQYAEHMMRTHRIPIAEYEEAMRAFNPVKFDARAWVRLARDAGMKYMVITAKHHDGFALWHSKVDDFTMEQYSPYPGDVLRELADACATAGIRLGFYYSHMRDWHVDGGAWKYGNDWDFDPNPEQDFDAYYFGKAMPQVEELMTRYGEVAVLWYDTPYGATPPYVDAARDVVKRHQPATLINSRVGEFDGGDYVNLADNGIPYDIRQELWENPGTLNSSYAYRRDDLRFRTAPHVIYVLNTIVARGGNYLLNVGPRGDGSIQAEVQDVLREVGRWLKVNGEAIYGAKASPFRLEDARWRVTRKPHTLYLTLFQWPGDAFRLPGLRSHVTAAAFLSDGGAVDYHQDADGLHLRLPDASPDPRGTVIRLRLDDEWADVAPDCRWDHPGDTYVLNAIEAYAKVNYTVNVTENHVTGFAIPTFQFPLNWEIPVPQGKGGDFEVVVTYQAGPESASHMLEVFQSVSHYNFARWEDRVVQAPLRDTRGAYTEHAIGALALGTVDLEDPNPQVTDNVNVNLGFAECTAPVHHVKIRQVVLRPARDRSAS